MPGMNRLRSLLARLTGLGQPMEPEAAAAQLRDTRAVAVGALGEALVRAELEVLGWPMLRNVILGAPGHSVEIDQLARAPGGVIVLGATAYSGHVDGDLRSERWVLSLRGGRSFIVPNAVRQNAAHMRAVRRVIDDASVPVRGYVVSAGAGRFASQLARAMVPAAELRTRLAGDAALQTRGGVKVEAAWSRLVAAAAEGESHRAAHASRRPTGADGRMPPSF
jgi:Nuclease-related domain